jgi:hypothetical protein
MGAKLMPAVAFRHFRQLEETRYQLLVNTVEQRPLGDCHSGSECRKGMVPMPLLYFSRNSGFYTLPQA